MSSPIDPHDPRLDPQLQDELTLMALGEPGDEAFVAHHATCAHCQDEVQRLRRTAELARAAARYPAAASPPATLWLQISDAVAQAGESATSAGQPEPTGGLGLPDYGTARRRHRPAPERVGPRAVSPVRARGRRLSAAVAVAATVVVAAGGGYALGRHGSSSSLQIAATAALAPQPGGPVAVSGTARITRHDNDLSLAVQTTELPYWRGYYAVWVFDPQANKMINVGLLDAAGRGTFSLPAGVDVRSYDVIDVSAQKFDGNPAHEQSVLRGELTQ